MKFAESDEHRAIYLDIQVGKLLPMGVVDPTTVYWMEFPKNPSSFATIDYDNQLSLALTEEIKFNSRDQVVIGELIHFLNYF